VRRLFDLRERLALWLAPWLRPDPPQSFRLTPETEKMLREVQEKWVRRRSTGGSVSYRVENWIPPKDADGNAVPEGEDPGIVTRPG
jgi:hypothetical protein